MVIVKVRGEIMKLYRDVEHNVFYTDKQLKKMFEDVKSKQPEEYQDITFTQWINNSLWQQGGTLEYSGTVCVDYVENLQEQLAKKNTIIYNLIIMIADMTDRKIDDDMFIDDICDNSGLDSLIYFDIMNEG